MKERISIIVPVYNAEKTLRRCVNSLTAQTYEALEIILVNDGSRDGSLALCRELAQTDDRIRVIDKPNGGVSTARNAGLEAAGGTYVMFCDSDDWVDPQWCQEMQQACGPGDMVICGIAWSNARPKEPEEKRVETAQRRELLHYPKLMSSPVNKIYLNEVIRREKLRFPEELRLGEDFAFVMAYLCAATGQLQILSRELYHYDVSTEDSLSKRAPTLDQCERFYSLITAGMETLGAMDEKSRRSRDRLVMGQMEWALARIAQDSARTFREKLALAGQAGAMNAWRCCSGQVIGWGNAIYRWLFCKKHARLLMLYMIAQAWKARLVAAAK